MLRVVLDPNVLVSALISPAGVPAQLIETILEADLGLIASPKWLAEADELAARPRFRRWFAQHDAEALVEHLWVVADIVSDPAPGPSYSRDPDDDCGPCSDSSFSCGAARRFHPALIPHAPLPGAGRSRTTDERGGRCRPSHAVRGPFR